MCRHYIIFLLFAFVGQVSAQDDVLGYDHLGLNIKYGANIPGEDYQDRFGFNIEAGIGLEYLLSSRNMVFSLEADVFIGSSVKEDVLSRLRLENGQILAVSGNYGSVSLKQRASYFGILAEKIIGKNQYRRGIKLGLGVGRFAHYIRILNPSVDVPQVRGDYTKGYDHKSVGPAIKERIAYNYVSKSRKIYFTFGFEFTQAFTKNIRAINLDTNLPENGTRLDLLYGINIKWTLPLKINKPLDEIYY